MNRAAARFKNQHGGAAKVTTASSPRLVTAERRSRGTGAFGVTRGRVKPRATVRAHVRVRNWASPSAPNTTTDRRRGEGEGDQSSGKRRRVNAARASTLNVASRVFERVFDRVYREMGGGAETGGPAGRRKDGGRHPPPPPPRDDDDDESMILTSTRRPSPASSTPPQPGGSIFNDAGRRRRSPAPGAPAGGGARRVSFERRALASRGRGRASACQRFVSGDSCARSRRVSRWPRRRGWRRRRPG